MEIFEISSIENKGTSVNISIPCSAIIKNEKAVSLEIKARKQNFSQLEEQISPLTNELPRILIVEDNNELRLFLKDLFTPSYQVFLLKMD